MSVELQVIRASEFIRLGADKYLDLEASKVALCALAQACCKRGCKCALVDLRTLPLHRVANDTGGSKKRLAGVAVPALRCQ